MSGWILSIVGIAFLGAMIDIVAPTGALNKFIKSIFSVCLIFVLVGPIKGFITTNTSNLDSISTNIGQDDNFLIKYNQSLARSYEEKIKTNLEEVGIYGVNVLILTNLANTDFEILEVSVYLKDLVLTDKINHTNKYERIEEVIKKTLSVSGEIVFYEWWFW